MNLELFASHLAYSLTIAAVAAPGAGSASIADVGFDCLAYVVAGHLVGVADATFAAFPVAVFVDIVVDLVGLGTVVVAAGALVGGLFSSR